jgi:3-keto-L-gulonate-6-phosphate decarboxylase
MEDDLTIDDVIATMAQPETKDLVLRMTRAVIVECLTDLATLPDVTDAKRGLKAECLGMLYHRVNDALGKRPPMVIPHRRPQQWGVPPKDHQ